MSRFEDLNPFFKYSRIFSFLTIVSLFGCITSRNDGHTGSDESIVENQEIEVAKTWYETNFILEEDGEKLGQLGMWEGNPNWSNYRVYDQNDGKRVIEVQFDWLAIKVPEHLSVEGFNRKWILQILVLFPQEDGDFVEYMLTIYPDEPGMDLDYENFKAGGYSNYPNDFSGEYHFHRSDGRFVGGWKIENGVKKERIKSFKTFE